MTHPIIRCYESVRQIAGLETELKNNGFTESQIFPNATVINGRIDDLTAAIANCGIIRSQATSLAELIRDGGAVAIVSAAFGTGAKATEILAKYKPTAVGAGPGAGGWDDAAPFSSLLHLPVLVDGSKPFQGNSGTPLIMQQNGRYDSMSGTPLLIEQKKGYLSFSGRPLILKGAPYTSLSGTPLLLQQAGEYQSYSGAPLLIDNPAPFSSMIGWATLSR